MVNFPGIENIKNDVVHKSIAKANTWELFALGFMDKSGVSLDRYNWHIEKYSLVYVLEGNGFFVDKNGKRYAITAGDFFQRFPNYKHQIFVNPESKWKECFLSVSKNIFSLFTGISVIKSQPNIGRIGLNHALVLKIWEQKERLKTSGELELPLRLLEIMQLIAQFHLFLGTVPEIKLETEIINSACIYLGNNFRENKDLKEFCKEKGIGYEYFRKIFKKHIDISPGQYRIKKRLDTAIKLLSTKTMTIGQVAWELGFSSQFEFSSHFKKHIGFPPSDYFK
jgi:AraC-like DNA-binding protein